MGAAGRGIREAPAAKLQRTGTGKLAGMGRESRGTCPSLLSRDMSNLKQLKICTKHFKQARESSRCSTGDKSSADTSGWAAQGEPFGSAAPKEQEKHRVLHRAAAGTDIWMWITVSRALSRSLGCSCRTHP